MTVLSRPTRKSNCLVNEKLLFTVGILLVTGMATHAELCKKCKELVYTDDEGNCVECGGTTSNGPFKLCEACSAKLGQCEHCRIALAGKKPAAQPSLKDLSAAPETIQIGGRSLLLKPHLWRDFMPVSPPDGKPLIALITLKTADNANLPKDINVGSVWLVNGDKLWSPTKKEVRRKNGDSSTMEIVVRDGPKWEPGINVDVIVELLDGQHQSHLIRVANQSIHRTD